MLRNSRVLELGTARIAFRGEVVVSPTWRDVAPARRLLIALAMLRIALLALLVGACEKDLVADQPDAAPDTNALPFGFDDSCVGVDWPTTAPDPLAMVGSFGLANATVEIHASVGDALLANGTTGNTASTTGKYSVDLPTGGAALDVYRRGHKDGYVDVYVYDAFPSFKEIYQGTPFPDPAFSDPSFVNVWGKHPDPSKGTLALYIYDCVTPSAEVHPVAGATIEAPPGADVLYIPADHVISDDAKLLTKTTAAGVVSIENLEPGTYDIPIHLGSLTYRSRPVKVWANADTVSPRQP